MKIASWFRWAYIISCFHFRNTNDIQLLILNYKDLQHWFRNFQHSFTINVIMKHMIQTWYVKFSLTPLTLSD